MRDDEGDLTVTENEYLNSLALNWANKKLTLNEALRIAYLRGHGRVEEIRTEIESLTRWAVPAGYAGHPAGSQSVATMVRADDLDKVLDS